MNQDNGGSRSGAERRQFDLTESSIERRSGEERRKGFDRRMGLGQRRGHQNPDDQLPIERRDQFRRIEAGIRKEKVTNIEHSSNDDNGSL